MPCSSTPALTVVSRSSRLRRSSTTDSILQVQEVREQQPRRPTPDDPYLRTHLFLLPCSERTDGNGEGGVGCGRPAVDGALEEDLSYLLFRQAVRTAARTCSSSSSRRPSATSAVRVMQLRVLRSRPGRDQISPQAYLVMKSWKSAVNSVVPRWSGPRARRQGPRDGLSYRDRR